MQWIYLSILAAFLQAIRTAGQKKMAGDLNAVAATWARYGVGFPLAACYAFLLCSKTDSSDFHLSAIWWMYMFGSAGFQFAATLLLVKLLTLRNFAVGTTIVKSESILTALSAAIIFGVSLSFLSWVAIGTGLAAILWISSKTQISSTTQSGWRVPLIGLGAGLGFALCSVLIREASQVNPNGSWVAAAQALAVSLGLQLILATVAVQAHKQTSWTSLWQHKQSIGFIGISGMLGSVAWFSAMAYQEAGLVKAVGQIEFVFTLLLTHFIFREKLKHIEVMAMLVVIASVILLIYSQ